jgi:SWI/SNF-related matrix-associated actin-dependent regulator 1 of chromatin subfamily A
MPVCSFTAELARGEAVLKFPYDDRLRRLLRAIPGRRWDPQRRAWCVPMAPEPAGSLTRLLAGLETTPHVSAELARELRRQRSRRGRELMLEVVRPDESWWLTFATDVHRELVAALIAHPLARELPAIARALVPLDERAASAVEALRGAGACIAVTPAAGRALHDLRDGGSERRSAARQRPERQALARARPWRGTIDVAGAAGEPVFVLLGDDERLPAEVLAHATRGAGCPATLPLTTQGLALVAHLDGWMTASARRCAAAVREGRAAPPAVLARGGDDRGAVFVLEPGHDPHAPAAFAALDGACAPGRVHADPFCVEQLDRFVSERGVWVEPRALELLQQVREEHARAAGLVQRSSAREAELVVAGLGGELKPFQRAGVAYALERRRTFLADEQGLGKTIEALATVQAADAYPAIVVCPASLKLNWARELALWLPGRSVEVLRGSAPRARDTPGADVTVVNYDVVAARCEELRALAPRALVLDESHHCKNPRAQRTQAVTRLAEAVAPEGLVLALTGTPVVNRPAELIPQLRILGRLQDFGSGAQFGARFRGPDAHVRLHWHLRARCMARRCKADVLPQLPAKTRSIVPVELDNEPEYRLAERDVVAWLATQPLDLRELDARVAAALRAERLVRLGALKRLAARGKLRAALAWIHDFHAAGEPLVVFARHREVQQRVLERFPDALHILGGDTPAARDRALRSFQAGDGSGLIVCSLDVAGHGLTLTRASNVAFLELDWTPARHEQAEDRCHRIGQRSAVGAHYLLAAHTVDETIAGLLERKRAVIGAVTDGREHDEESVLDGLVRELRGAPYRHLRAVA